MIQASMLYSGSVNAEPALSWSILSDAQGLPQGCVLGMLFDVNTLIQFERSLYFVNKTCQS